MITKQNILDALTPVNDPELNESLVKLNMIEDIAINDNNIEFRLMLTTIACPLKEFIKDECIEAIKTALPQVENVEVIFDARPLKTKSHNTSESIDTQYFKDVKYVILTASGKGGVGKTSVSVNLALSLKALGAKVGILDTDIYGPNIPNMLSHTTQEVKLIVNDNKKEIMIPPIVDGMPVLSMSFFIQPNQAVLWRGPMLNSIVQQFLFQAQWGELDYLIIDSPPGTGDVLMSLSQLAPIDGAVIVTTAQSASLTDVQRSITQFEKLNVPVLGIVENMAYFIPDDNPHLSYDLFGSCNGETIKKTFDIPLLASLPFSIEARQYSDNHQSIINENPDSVVTKEFFALAKKIISQISIDRYKNI